MNSFIVLVIKTVIIFALALGVIHIIINYFSNEIAYFIVLFFIMLGIDKLIMDYMRYKKQEKIKTFLNQMEFEMEDIIKQAEKEAEEQKKDKDDINRSE